MNLLPGAEDNVGYLVAGFIRAQTSYPWHVTKVGYFENSTFPNKPELNISLITQTRAENAANGSAAGEKHWSSWSALPLWRPTRIPRTICPHQLTPNSSPPPPAGFSPPPPTPPPRLPHGQMPALSPQPQPTGSPLPPAAASPTAWSSAFLTTTQRLSSSWGASEGSAVLAMKIACWL